MNFTLSWISDSVRDILKLKLTGLKVKYQPVNKHHDLTSKSAPCQCPTCNNEAAPVFGNLKPPPGSFLLRLLRFLRFLLVRLFRLLLFFFRLFGIVPPSLSPSQRDLAPALRINKCKCLYIPGEENWCLGAWGCMSGCKRWVGIWGTYLWFWSNWLWTESSGEATQYFWDVLNNRFHLWQNWKPGLS